uniref:Cytochrome P450 monooxygenase n=1 Tax=Nodulisporium sp. TaxID=1897413 RepID=A0A2R4QEY8_9PEZI|nr:cytochrome P450 monooxygenase [Nodulisporium sp.]
MFTPKPQLTSETSLDGPPPPTVHIPREVRRSIKVNEAYSKALDEHGPVIVVPRHGRDEYVIDHRYAHEILTDTKSFTFEKAVFDLLHLGFLAMFDDGTFVKDVDELVEKNVQPRMNSIIDRIFPVFESYFNRMEDELPESSKSYIPFPDIFYRIQLAVAHAMVVMILGEEQASSEVARHFAAVAIAMASLTGMHENTHEWVRFPKLWVLLNGLSAIFFTIIPRFFYQIVPTLWKTRKQHLQNGLKARHGTFVPLFDILLTKHYHERSGIFALVGFFRCVIVAVGVIFASIHQTVVAGFWILIKLTEKQDEYLPAIQHEWETVNPAGEALTVNKLAQLKLLDSFMREVLRTKGDSWGPVRQTTKAVRVGPYVLPKGAMCIVLIARAHQHPDNYGTEGGKFNGFQWAEKDRPTVQGAPDFLTFGLGRWACPGRQLAIHEIKIVLYMFFSKFDLKLRADTFRVTNTINTTSVAPEATFLLRRRLNAGFSTAAV